MPNDGGGRTLFPFEDFEPIQSLRERWEGRLISRIHWGVGPLPLYWQAVGLELDDGQRWAVIAAPVEGRGYRTQLFLRLINPQRIWTKTMTRHFRRGRAQAGEPEADAIQNQIEGELIRGIHPEPAPTRDGGEQFGLELSGGTVVWFRAGRSPEIPIVASLDVQVQRNERRLFTADTPIPPVRLN